MCILGYYMIGVQIYTNSGTADFRIHINGINILRSRDQIVSSADTVATGMLVHRLNVGDNVEIRAVGSFQMFGTPVQFNTCFHITFIHPA